MADDAQDRNLPASARKLRKARAEGQVVRSRDLSHAVALGVGGAIVAAALPLAVRWLERAMQAGLSFDAHAVEHTQVMGERLGQALPSLLGLVLPLGLAMAALAVAAAAVSGGWNLTWQPLQPKFSKLDPFAGLGRLFSRQHLIDTLKVTLLALLLLAVGGLVLQSQLPGFAALVRRPLPAALGGAGELVGGGLLPVGLALALFALIDVPLQRHLLARRLRMTAEEAKKEHKETEGNPQVKGRIRSRMREMANRRMLAKVPAADLVVMNPTHYAVALKYDEKTMGAPRVVAKGADLLAMIIRDRARDANVPVLQMPPLARALYRHVEIDGEIPAALFGAVAQVLAWVYQLRAAVAAGRAMNVAPPSVEVPPGMDPLDERREPEL